jgi:hypothetical protein
MSDSIVTHDLRGYRINDKYDHTDGNHQPTEESKVGLFQLVSGFSIRQHLKGLNTDRQ